MQVPQSTSLVFRLEVRFSHAHLTLNLVCVWLSQTSNICKASCFWCFCFSRVGACFGGIITSRKIAQTWCFFLPHAEILFLSGLPLSDTTCYSAFYNHVKQFYFSSGFLSTWLKAKIFEISCCRIHSGQEIIWGFRYLPISEMFYREFGKYRKHRTIHVTYEVEALCGTSSIKLVAFCSAFLNYFGNSSHTFYNCVLFN